MLPTGARIQAGGLLLLSCACAWAQTSAPVAPEQPKLTPDQQKIVEQLVQLCEQQRWERLQQQERVVAELKAQKVPAGTDKQQAAQLQKRRGEQLRAAQAQLKELQDKRKPFLPDLPEPGQWKIGAVGRPQALEWHVEQVGENQVMARFFTSHTEWRQIGGGQAVQKVVPDPARPYVLRNYPTKGVVTGTKIDMSNVVVRVVDTQAYSTTDGASHDTFVLEAVDPAVVRAFQEAVRSGGSGSKKRP